MKYHAITCTEDECCPSCPIGDPTVEGGAHPWYSEESTTADGRFTTGKIRDDAVTTAPIDPIRLGQAS